MKKNPPRTLAIHPGHDGFGFVVMEGPNRIVDWGIKANRATAITRSFARVETLIVQYRPQTVLLARTAGRRKSPRARRLLQVVGVACRALKVRTRRIARKEIRAVFSRYGRTKAELALAVVHKLPQLSRWFPRRRKVWGGEDHRMKIFEAALLALTFYAACSERTSSESRHRSTKAANCDS